MAPTNWPATHAPCASSLWLQASSPLSARLRTFRISRCSTCSLSWPAPSSSAAAPAILAAVAAFFAYDFFFIQPHYALTVKRADEWVALGLLLAAGIITGQLAVALRDRAREAGAVNGRRSSSTTSCGSSTTLNPHRHERGRGTPAPGTWPQRRRRLRQGTTAATKRWRSAPNPATRLTPAWREPGRSAGRHPRLRTGAHRTKRRLARTLDKDRAAEGQGRWNRN